MTLRRLAPAKVNLYLHVAAPDARGYHPLRSMVAFADVGDELQLIPGGKGHFKIDGPFAEGLSTGEDNLVMKAVRLFEAETGKAGKFFGYRLTKNLPLASGIGGGSADAGAILRLLRGSEEITDEALSAIAARTGADGVMCLWSKACIAEGYGEKLSPIVLPALPCVLINPGVECPTPEVFRAYDAIGSHLPIHTRWHGEGIIPAEMLGERHNMFMTVGGKWPVKDVIDYLTTTRNDLEAPAIALRPVIGDVLASLRAEPQTRFARMSGSGATCFALCDTATDASLLAGRLRKAWPDAWVQACTLS
ncbi:MULTISPECIES: 4-(cytidine 5'-diphospho)-2-C-methyl-D-erythritol kinase [Asticcacaulis]|uniref:4-(cytidine 5'-diphospho)-2-C-methyl-D-erythritol kinase n=1 Tax=Asticcacaulis TaxID=76890 RepID=UPI001AE54C98|nr:4-(cytidine 5'-diphospho)-2-C-methyl-D-erythritol kinase [Asticcacaulis sp. BE141]